MDKTVAVARETDRIPSTLDGGFSSVRNGSTLRFLGVGDPDHLHPVSAYFLRPGQLLRAMVRQLFAYPATQDLSDPQRAFTPAPDVALETPTVANGGLSADHLTYTLRLRSGVLWDTTPPREVTAHDFIRGLKRLPNPVAGAGALPYFTSTILGMQAYCEAYDHAFAGRSPTAAELAAFQNQHSIEGLQALDDKTLVIRLCQPANDFLNILAMGFASAAPVEYDHFLPDSEALRRHLIANGPYRLAHYGAGGHRLRLERNPVWQQASDPIRHQYVDAIEVEVAQVPEAEMRRKIAAGEVDLAWSFTVVSWAQPEPALDDFPRSYPGYALNPYLVFNLQSPNAGGAMGNRLVRQAIAYAVDKVAISRIFNALDGVATRALHSVIPPGSVGHRSYNPYPTPGDRGDKRTARTLLEAAGYGDGLTLIAAVRRAKLHQDVMQSVAADLEAIGIRLTFELYSQGDYYGSLLGDPAQARAGAWDLAEPGWTPDWFGNNGRTVVQPLFQTNFRAGTTNYGGYSNPQVDRLIAAALQAPDPQRADELWHEVDKLVMHDLPILPLLAFAAMTSRFHSPRVKNAIHVPQIEFFDITHLWIDEAE